MRREGGGLVLNVFLSALPQAIRGHGGHINEIRSHPRNPHIVLTASHVNEEEETNAFPSISFFFSFILPPLELIVGSARWLPFFSRTKASGCGTS